MGKKVNLERLIVKPEGHHESPSEHRISVPIKASYFYYLAPTV